MPRERNNAYVEEYKGYTINIAFDPEPLNPRMEWDNFSKMICFHKRYDLGDKHDLKHGDFSGWDELSSHLVTELNAKIIYPLYLYDHSGITISVGKFSCPWDSGQVGFVFATHDDIKKEFGEGPEAEEKARKLLLAEVETYDNYLTGQVFGFIVEKDGEDLDSCWGYFGEYKDALEEAKSVVDHRISSLSYKDMTETEKFNSIRDAFLKIVDSVTTREGLYSSTGLSLEEVDAILKLRENVITEMTSPKKESA